MDDTYGRGPLLLLSGRANRPLALEIGERIGKSPDVATVKQFADGEIFVRIDRNARGRDVYIVQPTGAPADNIMELLLLIDAARRASAARVTAVVPYFGYGRQDRKDQPRVAIGAKLAANLIVAAGADRVISIDFHQHQIQGFFDIPTDNLYAAPVFGRDIEDTLGEGEETIIVSPDVGGVVRARAIARRIDADLAIIDKRREQAGISEVMNIIGDVDGKRCILVDDIVDSAGTLCNAAVALKEAGASSVGAYVTHGVLSGGAVARVSSSPIEMMVTTDSILATEAVRVAQNIRQITIASLLAEAILRISNSQSVSSLFD